MSEGMAPQRVDLAPGQIIQSSNSSYTVEKNIGEGGFGVVCKVRGPGNDYALKLTKMWEFMPNERLEYAKRFRQEYEYSKGLESHYIVRSYDFALVSGNPFMVMDFCENGSLRDKFNSQTSLAETKRIAAGILKGLTSLHDQGIIHRDIKPENILFDSSERPKLADFGISASVKKRHTQANFLGHAKAVFATCVYSPPEQMDHTRAMKVMGNTNDIYAFGATMYEWLTGGHYPFGTYEEFMADMNAFEKKRKSENWDRQTLERSVNGSFWVDIIDRCLKYEPQERYQHCCEILDLIDTTVERHVENTSVNVKPDSSWQIEVKNGDEIGRVYNLTNLASAHQTSTLTLGWLNPQNPFLNHIPLAEEFTQFISQHHATLEHDPRSNYWFILDGQHRNKDGQVGWHFSTNGVLVNSRKIGNEPHRLNPGDIIMIGDTSLKVRVI